MLPLLTVLYIRQRHVFCGILFSRGAGYEIDVCLLTQRLVLKLTLGDRLTEYHPQYMNLICDT